MRMPWHLEGRLTARYHVQVELLDKPTIELTPVQAEVVAKVVRVFRTDGGLRVGSDVRFCVAVCRDGDDRPYGEPWMLFVKFKYAKHMEVFLDGTPPDCEVSNRQVAVILRLTDGPSMRVPSREELNGLPLIPPKSDLDTSNVL